MKPALRSSGCYTCRSLVLRQVVSSHAPAISQVTRASVPTIVTPGRKLGGIRWSSSLEATFNALPGKQSPKNDGQSEDQVSTDDQSVDLSEQNDEVPWYLQVEPPKHPTLVHEPPPIPAVPTDSPDICGPLLKHVAEELGLDDLNLLDLRSLDPPPSLGPKLLMLFATARSERHLHVSAGRLVGWLRGRGINADADGLLGRNELKIRLRRKARKAKLLGKPEGSNVDDGISTRWICVNLGTLGWKSEDQEVIGADGRSSGFGTPQTGTTIVVQLFTDARRKELDLERLWTTILRRDGDPEAIEDYRQLSSGQSGMSTEWHPSSSPSQRRYFSTSARMATAEVDIPTSSASADLMKVRPSATENKFHMLNQLRADLETLPPAQIVNALTVRETHSPEQSSHFIHQWHTIISQLPAADSWGFRLWLHHLGASLAHPDYTLATLEDLLQEMQLSGIGVTREQYLQLLSCCYTSTTSSSGGNAHAQQSAVALKLLATMYERGESVLATDVLVGMIESLAKPGRGLEAEKVQTALEQLLTQADLPCMEEGLLLRLMDVYANQEDWDKFWDVWRIPPRFLKARSPDMYAYVYGRLAQTQHQARCIDGIRRCLQEMLNENPPVQPEGRVMGALKACIKVADPDAARIARGLVVKSSHTQKLANREFVKILRDLRLA